MRLSAKGAALSSILFALHDKPERVPALLSAHTMVEPKEAAHLFGEVWTNSESLFNNQEALRTLIAFVQDTGTARFMMDEKERATLARLKKKAEKKGHVTLYRGAAQHNVEGFSWTTNEDTCRFFARRNALDGQPLIVKADFAADDLLAYMGGRNEFEVIVDLTRDDAVDAISIADIEYLPEIEVTGGHALMWRIQAFGNASLHGDEGEDVMLMMNVSMAKKRGTALVDIQGQWKRAIEQLDTFPGAFTAKRAEFEKKIADTERFYHADTSQMFGDMT